MDEDLVVGIVSFALLACVIAGSAVYAVAYSQSDVAATITVDAKDIKYHENDAKYLISSSTGEVFEITDTMVFWRYDSSDLYFNMKEGHTYKCTVAGWRIPFFTMYRNILTAEEV